MKSQRLHPRTLSSSLLEREFPWLVVAMLPGHGVRIVAPRLLVCVGCPDIYKVGNRSGVRTIKFTQELLLARAHTITDIVCLGTSLTNRIQNFSTAINCEITTKNRVMTLPYVSIFIIDFLIKVRASSSFLKCVRYVWVDIVT